MILIFATSARSEIDAFNYTDLVLDPSSDGGDRRDSGIFAASQKNEAWTDALEIVINPTAHEVTEFVGTYAIAGSKQFVPSGVVHTEGMEATRSFSPAATAATASATAYATATMAIESSSAWMASDPAGAAAAIPVGGWVGIALGVLALIALLALCLWCLVSRRPDGEEEEKKKEIVPKPRVFGRERVVAAGPADFPLEDVGQVEPQPEPEPEMEELAEVEAGEVVVPDDHGRYEEEAMLEEAQDGGQDQVEVDEVVERRVADEKRRERVKEEVERRLELMEKALESVEVDSARAASSGRGSQREQREEVKVQHRESWGLPAPGVEVVPPMPMWRAPVEEVLGELAIDVDDEGVRIKAVVGQKARGSIEIDVPRNLGHGSVRGDLEAKRGVEKVLRLKRVKRVGPGRVRLTFVVKGGRHHIRRRFSIVLSTEEGEATIAGRIKIEPAGGA